MTDDERVKFIIREYRANLGEPTYTWPHMDFDKFAYSRWAAEMIENYVFAHEHEWTAFRSVEEFKNLMGKYMCRSNYSEVNFIFEIAYETACDISEIILAML